MLYLYLSLAFIFLLLISSLSSAENTSVFTFKFSKTTLISCPGNSRVHKTILDEIAFILKQKSRDSLHITEQEKINDGSLFVSLIGESAISKTLIEKGLVDIHNIPLDKDAYELIVYNHTLYLLGNTPRGLLQAVYELQDIISFKEKIDEGFHRKGVFVIQKRIFHQRFDQWPGNRSDIRYISHLGASHCLIDHDWNGDIRHMQGFVSSNVFPKAVNTQYVLENHKKLRQLIDNCLDYGIEPMFWIVELPCQCGPWIPEDTRKQWLEKYPDEVLSDSGTYQGKVLCFSHQDVQKYYKELLTAFFKEFPFISVLSTISLAVSRSSMSSFSVSRILSIVISPFLKKLYRNRIHRGLL